jgi:phage baseplate assembly protein W
MATTDKLYSDIPLNFIANPATGDVRPIGNESAVKSSLLNLMRSLPGSKPFYPEYGVNIEKYLFELADPTTESMINEEIARCIKQYEPRVDLLAVESSMEDYGINIKIEYYVKNIPDIQILETTLTRT